RCRIDPADRAQIASVSDKARAEHGAVARELTVVTCFLDQDVEAVAGVQITVEIDFTAEDICNRHGQLSRLASVSHRGNHRRMITVYSAAYCNDIYLLVIWNNFSIQLGWPRPIARDDAE